MKLSRYWLVTTALLLLSMLLAACGGGGTPAAQPTTAPAAEPTAAPAAQEPTAAPAAQDPTAALADPAASGEVVELRMAWWGGQSRHDRTLQVIELFQQQYPNIKIISEYGGWDDHWTKLATQAAGGNPPDIIQQDYARIEEWVSRGQLLSLDSYIESGAIDLSNVNDGAISGGRIEGQLYGLSLGTNALTVLYNPDMFEQAGVEPLGDNYTWAELLEKATQVKDSQGVYGIEGFYNAEFFKLWLKDHGLWLYNDEGTALGYDDDALAAEFFQLLLDAQNTEIAPTREFDASRGTVTPENYLVTTGEAASILLWSNMPAAIAAAAGDRQFELALPPESTDGGQGVYLKPSMFFSITAASQHPEEAALFIDFFTNSVEANQILAAERGVPISSAIREALQADLPPIQQKVFDYISKAEQVAAPINPPDPATHAKILSDVYNPMIDQLLYGEITPEQAAAQFREQASAILANP